MSEIEKIIAGIVKFRDERDWEQFHNSKDLAVALNIEAAELLELYLWKDNEGANISKLEEELADVLIYSLLLAHKHNLDVKSIIENKLQHNSRKYPVSKSKGSSKKYNEL